MDTASRPLVIDSHAHLVPRQLLEDLHSGAAAFPSIEVTAHQQSFRVAFAGGAPTRPVVPSLTDNDRRVAWLTENSIDLQVTGGWLDIFGYDLPAEEGAEWSAVLTDALRAAVVPERQIVLGTVPLQDPVRAAEALRTQRATGLPGVMIATRAGETELSDPAMLPFWEAADETGAVVFLHPGFASANPRYEDFGLVNGLGRLEDTTVTLARLLYAGIPARHPRARILVAHAGAALPYVLGRLVRNHLLHPDSTADPLKSFEQLYFDSVVFDSDALRFLVDKVGAGRVLMGSDYPFPIGDLAPRAVLEAAKLPDLQRVMLAGDNARRLFMADAP
jgi:aminocarboxymuconate-semialdehyde decarboxylase